MNKPIYIQDGNRVMVSLGGKCPYECAYCYTSMDGFKGFEKRDPSKITSELTKLPESIDLIQLGCDTEPFIQEDITLKLIKEIPKYGKDFSFATKKDLSSKTIDALADINQYMQKNNNIMVAFVSLLGPYAAQKYEPKVPSPEKRVETIKNLYKSRIPTFVYIGPLFPNITDEDINKVFEQTKDNCTGYIIGCIFYDEQIAEKIELNKGEPAKLKMVPDNRNLLHYVDPRKSTLLKRENVFNVSRDAIAYAKTNLEKIIAE